MLVSSIAHKIPMIKDPIRFTVSVPIGKTMDENDWANPEIAYRPTVPIAPPRAISTTFVMSREWDLNPRPAVYETAALPLSYLGIFA